MKNTLARVLLVCGAMLMAAASGSAKEKITFTSNQDRPQPAKPESCEIHVFADGKPDRRVIELGVVNYHDERHRSRDGALKLEVAMPKIKARACKAGADALIDIRVTEVRRLEFAMFNVRAVAVQFVPD